MQAAASSWLRCRPRPPPPRQHRQPLQRRWAVASGIEDKTQPQQLAGSSDPPSTPPPLYVSHALPTPDQLCRSPTCTPWPHPSSWVLPGCAGWPFLVWAPPPPQGQHPNRCPRPRRAQSRYRSGALRRSNLQGEAASGNLGSEIPAEGSKEIRQAGSGGGQQRRCCRWVGRLGLCYILEASGAMPLASKGSVCTMSPDAGPVGPARASDDPHLPLSACA